MNQSTWVRIGDRGIWCKRCGALEPVKRRGRERQAGIALEIVVKQLTVFLDGHRTCRQLASR